MLSDHYGVSMKIDVYYNIPLYFFPAFFGFNLLCLAVILVMKKKDQKSPIAY
jgi:hypothetical protein